MKQRSSLDEFSTNVLKCRSLGHAWDPVRTFLEKEGRKEFLRLELECLRCPVTRTDEVVRRTGVLDRRTYGGYQDERDPYLLTDPKSYGSRVMLNNRTRRMLYERIYETSVPIAV